MKVTAWLRKNEIPLLIGSALLVGLVLSFGAALYTSDSGGLLLNLGTEIIGAVVTYFLFTRLIGRKQKKADLIHKMGSHVKEIAIPAAEEVVRHGWHTDGSLQRAWMEGAQLPGVELIGADLQGAFLTNANLQGAVLEWADLQGAFLVKAKLQGAGLTDAKLQRAHLARANLQGAHLIGANLRHAEFTEDTTLPDGTKWTPDTDMARFTDPNHPDFWVHSGIFV